ncbi:MAG: toll/interleukin-1 receptor domain-containing protein [Nitrospira sp.]|nr:toll/interleukin-1 receptor domain-containing protein [Nitrospira sp.]
MSSIFISYRREDSAGWTGRLVGQLKKTFGQDYIFSDIDTIEPGADFTEAITCAVGSCDILLAVIGPRWITETDTNKQRRLDDPADWVRIEIAAALTRKIRVIPVLVGRANMPAAKELPPDIKALAERQSHELSD